MLDLPIVDAHLHLWDPDRFRMPWIDGNPVLQRPFELEQFDEHTAGLPIQAMVYLEVALEPAYTFLEARRAAALAEQDRRLQGVVAAAPLEHGERARAYLAALVELGPALKGIRRITQFEPDPDFCLRPDFVRGVQLVPEYGFSMDLCIDHRQLAATVELVRRCPGTSFILDHIAKPDIRGRAFEPWATQMGEMASLPNVVCKVSGVVTEADHRRWTPEDIAPYVEHVLALFGEDRVFFGSDWPVVLHAGGYRRWAETLDQLTAYLSPSARRKLWAENARRVYRLEC